MAEQDKDSIEAVSLVNETLANLGKSRDGQANKSAHEAWNEYENKQDAARGQPKPSSPKP